METQLIYDALSEIAQVLGDSNYNPISTSLLCLRHGISFDEKGKILVAFNQVLQRISFDDLTLSDFRLAMEQVVPATKEFDDLVIVAFVKAYARNHLAELTPFARTLD